MEAIKRKSTYYLEIKMCGTNCGATSMICKEKTTHTHTQKSAKKYKILLKEVNTVNQLFCVGGPEKDRVVADKLLRLRGAPLSTG